MKVIIIVMAFILATAGGLRAQGGNTAQLSGTAQDQSGAAVPNAQVKATQTDTSFTRETTTDQTGSYSLPNLPIGPYRLEVTAPGFSTYVQTGIVLQVDASPKVNIVMQVGAVAQQVQVEAAALTVETTGAGVGQSINNQSVLELPLNGRNVTELVLLSGAATTCGNCGGGFVGTRQYPVIAIQIAGGSPAGTYYTMDGGSHNDPGNNLNMAVPFPDALQEFKVETGAVPARYGQHANAVVTLVTKSGTNAFHGDVFEFLRNGAFNARNAYAASRDTLKRNQFGGTFGGPILKNKLFLFAGYQRTITRSVGTVNGTGTVIQDFVPTAAMLQGDFTAYASKACNNNVQKLLTFGSPNQFVTTTDSSNGNVISIKINPTLFDPVAVQYLKYIPVSTDPCGRYQLSYPIPSTDDQYLGRVDYQISDKQSFFVRYFRAHFNSPYSTANTPGNALASVSDLTDNLSASLVVGHTYVFNPFLINSFHGTFIDEPNSRIPAPFFSPTDLGSKMFSTDFAGHNTSLSVSPGFGLGSGSNGHAVFNYRVYGFSDDVDLIRGSHQISFGVNYLYQSEFEHNTQFSNGVFSFNGARTGLSLSDFMLGLAAADTQGADGVVNDRKPYLGLYIQDGWKIRSRLTLTYGLRWEPAFPLINLDNHVMRFDKAAFVQGVKSTVYVNSPPGFTYPGDPGYPGQGMAPGNKKIFSPRFGLAYDPRGQGREVVRAAYGIFVESQPIFDHIFVASNPPWGATVTLNNISLSDPFAGFSGGNPFPLTLGPNVKFPNAGLYRVEQAQNNQQYTQQWNLSVEKQLGNDWRVSVNYIGNKTTHAWSAQDINAPVYNAPIYNGSAFVTGPSTTGNEQARRPLTALNPTYGPLIGSLIVLNTGGDANYNGMLLSVNKAFTHGYSLIANYTWSHCINEFDPHQSLGGSNVDPNNVRATRGNCTGDVRQLVNLSGVVSSPKFSSRALQAVAGNWQLSTIVKIQSGNWLSVLSGKDNAFTGIGGQFADLIGNPVLSNPTPDMWFNTAAYVVNAPGTIGNSGRNSILGPHTWNLNTALTRKFFVKEARALEFRVEAFNLLNHTELGNPVTTLSSADFGRVRSAADPRILQLAGKYTF